jgi:hypothetical protein
MHDLFAERRSRPADFVAAAVALAVTLGAPASPAESPLCSGRSVCAERHTCEELRAMIRRQGSVDIEYESAHTPGRRGRNDFKTSCSFVEREASWRVFVQDRLVCELRSLCFPLSPDDESW